MALRPVAACTARDSVRGEYPSLRPVIVIAGENDRLEPEQVLRDNLLPYLTKAELHVIPRTGHLTPLEAPADLARILQTAIAEAKPAQRH